MLSVLHNLPQLFHNISRIEAQFTLPLSLTVPTPPFLWSVTSQEDALVFATIRIRDIVERNVSHLRSLETDYAVFAQTYRRVCALDTQELAERSDSAVCRAEMDVVRATTVRLTAETHDRTYLGLFCVDCSHVNAMLLAGFARWTNRLLLAFQDHTSRLNGELRHEYKDVAARLAKKPMDLYELVDAEEFAAFLKTTKLRELQDKASAIKERLAFLLFERGDVRIDMPVDIASDAAAPGASSTLALFRLAPDVLTSTAKTIKWQSHITTVLRNAEASLVNERARIETIFLAKRTRFQAEIEEFDAEVKGFAKKGDLRHAATYVVQLAKMNDTLFAFRKTMEAIVEEETKLQWKTTDFSKLDDIAEEMAPYEQLWKTAREFRELSSRWLRGNVFELEPSDGMQTLHQMLSVVSNVSKLLYLNAAATALTAEMVKKQITDFRENARLVGAILNPAMKTRHLKEIAALIGVALDPLEPVTLLKLLENGAFDHLSAILDISQHATQEKHVEDALAEIAAEWNDLAFEFKPAKAGGNVITSTSASSEPKTAPSALLRRTCVEEIERVVEENQVRLQALLCLQHALPFANEIAAWMQFTQSVRRLVGALGDVGRMWKALAPLFAANVVDASSKEAKLFSTADHLYVGVVAQIQKSPRCRDVVARSVSRSSSSVAAATSDTSASVSTSTTAPLSTEPMLADLHACLELLEAAKDNLRVGLDSKRASFARFCFLSDLELVSALSCRDAVTGIPHVDARVLWQHLAPCFPGIHVVQTNAAREITAAVSSAGEQLSLGSPIATAKTSTTAWLSKVEAAMVTILQAAIRAAISDAGRKEFRKWCLLWPEQVVLVAIQHAWTLQCERASRHATIRDVVSAYDAVVQSLRDKLDAVAKELKAAMHAHMKLSLASVLVLLKHLYDVSRAVVLETQALAVEASGPTAPLGPPNTLAVATTTVSSSSPHELAPSQLDTLAWLAQPRCYYEDNTFVVKLATATPLPYGFEYFGNRSPTFVVTPLTLRCFHAIAQAATVLSRGTCLSGAASVGKSTIAAALAQTCGQLFVSHDCVNALSFAALLQRIRGAAACGAWLAIESFERLSGAQASTIAHLCAHVMDTLAAKQSQCTLVGHKLRLKKGCYFLAVERTSTSLGSSASLPEDSTHLPMREAEFFFKRLVVPAPDVEVITESLLQQRKFVNATELAKVVVVVLRAFERGVATVHGGHTYSAAALTPGFLNLRLVKRVVARAVELSWREQPDATASSSSPTRLLLRPNDRGVSAAVGAAAMVSSRRVVSHDALSAHDVEKMEQRLVCLALRDELSATTPVAHLDAIDHVLRDVATNSLTRELRVAKSFRLGSRLALASTIAGTAAAAVAVVTPLQAQALAPVTLEDAVEHVVRTTASAWTVFGGASFGPKVLQLVQVIKVARAVVVSGDVQSGKTALYRAVARALTHLAREQSSGDAADTASPPSAAAGHRQETLSPPGARFKTHEVVAPTRCVVLAPRALTLESLLGTKAEHFGNTLLANLMRDAKRAHRHDRSQTWLVLDGDIATSWSEKLLLLLDELYDDVPGHQRGLLLATGKRVFLPRCMRLVFETTDLADASPASLTRVGVVNLGASASQSSARDWRGMYIAWKALHEAEFSALATEIFEILDALVDETLDASLDFVETAFQKGFPQLRLGRVRALLALFHSSMRQSWTKLSSMVSAKQRRTAIHCFYLQAIVWSVGSTCDAHERQLFHEFLRHWIIHGPHAAQSSLKRVLVLFFPSGTTGTTAGVAVASAPLAGQSSSTTTLLNSSRAAASGAASTATMKDMIYAFGFSVEYGLKWMRWPEYYDVWLQAQASLSASSSSDARNSSNGSGASGESGDDTVASLSDLAVPTGPIAAAICLTNHLLLANYPVLLDGPSDSGKSVCGATWLALNDTFARSQAAAEASMEPNFGGINADVDAATATQFQQVFVGQRTTAADVLEQIVVLMERPARDRHATPKTPSAITSSAVDSSEPTSAPDSRRLTVLRPDQSATTRARKRMSFVFIDDLHCVRTETHVASALELLRQLVEHRQVVHPSLHQVLACQNIVPFAAMQATAAFASDRARRNVSRLTSRFVRVALPVLTDAELSSICAAVVPLPSLSDSVGPLTITQLSGATAAAAAVTAAGDASLFGGAHEAQQLVAVVIKASIKLFRFVSTEFALYAAKTPFDPLKLHYAVRARDVLDVIRSVCCDAKPTLSFAEKPLLARLWCHESARTFADRLMDPHESSIFHQHVRDIALSAFALTPDALFPSTVEPSVVKNSVQSHLWLAQHLHFTFIGESSGAGFLDGYREVTEMHKVELSLERTMMAMYRTHLGTESLEVVICDDVVRHVLRLARLLRTCGQHILVLGRRGTKMATLTRLAAFVCKKTAVVFSVPSTVSRPDDSVDTASGDSDADAGGLAAWTRELKAAMLRSVRRRDESVVFVFKDTSLASVAYYDVIERFVSGAKLPSAVISYDDLDENILAMLRELAHQEQDASRRSSGSRTLVQRALGSKASVLEYFFSKVREKLQMVVILSEPDGAPLPRSTASEPTTRLARILWHAPQLLKCCAVNYVGAWSDASLVAMALKSFALSPDMEKDRALQLAQTAAQIYQTTQRCWRLCTASHQAASRSEASTGLSTSLPTSASSKAMLPPRLSWFDRVPPLRLEPSMLLDQVGLFLKTAGMLQREITRRKDMYATGLAFLDASEQILASETAQTQVLQPEMRKRTELTRRMSGTLEKEKLTSDKLHRALALAISLGDAQQQRLAQVEAEYHELVKASMAVFERVQSKIAVFQVAKASERDADERLHRMDYSVNASQDNAQSDEVQTPAILDVETETSEADLPPADSATDAIGTPQRSPEDDARDAELALQQYRRALIKSFGSIKPAPTALKQLAECLGLIFGIEPVEARDELDPDEVVMDYWESLTARMKTLAFWDELLAYDMETRASDRVLARVLPICTSPDFEVALFASLHELAAYLCEWVQAWAAFAKDIVLAGPKLAQLVHEREALAQAQRDVQAHRQELAAQHTANVEANALRHVSELERQDIEARLQENASTLQMATSVWNVLASSRTKWRAAYERYTAFAAQWIGDLMLATSTIAYASAASAPVRRYLRSQWSMELRKHCLIHAPQRALHELFVLEDVQLGRWHVDGIPRTDANMLENAVVVAQSYRFPLLLDPLGVATAWLMKHETGSSASGSSKLQVINCATIGCSNDDDDAAMWKQVELAAKKQQPLVLTNFSAASAERLGPLLEAKRRSLFEAVNRDISSLSGGTSGSSSSVSSGGGASSSTAANALARFAGTDSAVTNNVCWFQIPSHQASKSRTDASASAGMTPQQQQQSLLRAAIGDAATSSPLIEFGSETWRVYIVYSQSGDVPDWMLQLASQLTIVRFGYSSAVVEAQSLHRVVDAHGERHILTEIETLESENLLCQEQVDALEHEVLDFFSTEEPALVYADVSKALRIIGNRSALHTLERSRTELQRKVVANIAALERYRVIVRRSVDLALVWRDTAALVTQSEASGARRDSDCVDLSWIWTLLTQSLKQCEPQTSLDDMARVYTHNVCALVTAGLCDERRVVFELLLAMRLHERALASFELVSDTSGANDSESDIRESDATLCHRDCDALYRTLEVVQCDDETQLRLLCANVSAKLVALRPEALAPSQWRSLCYVADASHELQAFVLEHAEAKVRAGTDPDIWHALATFDASQAKALVVARPLVRLSALLRLCVISVVHTDVLLGELEWFSVSASRESGASALESQVIDASVEQPDEQASASGEEGASDDASASTKQAAVPLRTSRSGAPHTMDTLADLYQRFSSAQAPIIVTTSRDDNFLRHVERVALRAKMTIDQHTLAVAAPDDSDDDLDAFERRVLAAMGKGHWVVLPHAHTTPRRLARLQRMFATLEAEQLHADFRLWVSSLESESASVATTHHGTCVDSHSIYKQPHRSFALKRTLEHVIAVLADDAQCRELVETPCASLLKRIGLLHAVLSTRDHFGFAHWKIAAGDRDARAFGDGDLRAMVRALHHIAMPIASSSASSTTSASSPEALDLIRMTKATRASAAHVYGARLLSRHDRELLSCCLDAIFPLADADAEATDTAIADAAALTIPEIVVMVERLDALPWEALVTADSSAIQQLWHSAELGPDVSTFPAALGSGPSRTLAHDLFGLRRRRQQRIVAMLVQVLEESGYVRSSSTGASRSTAAVLPSPAALAALPSPIESLLKLALELESVTINDQELALRAPSEYKTPVSQLIHHELLSLNSARSAILSAIRRIQAVRCLSFMALALEHLGAQVPRTH